VLKAARGSGWLFRAIYAFHAAKIWNILDVPARFSPPAHVVTLERN
jgi:DNA helicase II / ATP-dependent DNA helicase PcrA